MIDIIPNWHPIFVHFTVALFSVSTGLYVVSLFTPNEQLKAQWRIVARWNLWFGMSLTLITVLTGWYAYNTVSHDDPSHLAMTDHRNWALLTATLYLLATVWSIVRHRVGKEASPLLILLLIVAFTSLGSTAWRGGELVYRYGLGVMSLPNTSKHAHEKSDVQEHHSAPAASTLSPAGQDDAHGHSNSNTHHSDTEPSITPDATDNETHHDDHTH